MRPYFSAAEALLMFCVVVMLLIATSPLLVHLGLGGVIVAQLAIIGGVPLATALVRAAPVAHALGVRRCAARALAGGVLVGAAFWCVNLWAIVPMTDADADELRNLEKVLFENDLPVWLVVVAMSLVPAVCEEVLARGVIARSLRPRLGMAGAIIASALLFGLMHMSLARLAPTAAFGVVLAYLTLAAGSVVPAMIAHALNNGIALLLAGGQIPAIMSSVGDHTTAWGLGATGVCALGAAISWGSELPQRAKLNSS